MVPEVIVLYDVFGFSSKRNAYRHPAKHLRVSMPLSVIQATRAPSNSEGDSRTGPGGESSYEYRTRTVEALRCSYCQGGQRRPRKARHSRPAAAQRSTAATTATYIGDSRRYVSFVNTVASALRRGRRWEAYCTDGISYGSDCGRALNLCSSASSASPAGFTPSQSRAALVRGIDLRNSCASVTHSSTSAFAHRATYSSSLLVESSSRFTFAITST